MDKREVNINELYGAATTLNMIMKATKRAAADTEKALPGTSYLYEKFVGLYHELNLEIASAFKGVICGVNEDLYDEDNRG